jgi:hypothetical protein
MLRAFLDQPRQALDARCLDEVTLPAFQLGHAGTQP